MPETEPEMPATRGDFSRNSILTGGLVARRRPPVRIGPAASNRVPAGASVYGQWLAWLASSHPPTQATL